jgi:siderophore synthetase component
MKSTFRRLPTPTSHQIIVRPQPEGQYTAQVFGLAEVRAVAATETEAVEQVHRLLAAWLDGARWVQVEVGNAVEDHSFPALPGQRDPNDPLEQAYLEELARLRREDLEHTLQGHEEPCSGTSSTPIT